MTHPRTLIDQVHHDSGPLYVPQQPSALGEIVKVRVWAPAATPVRSIAVRYVEDGEPRAKEMTPGTSTAQGTWWEGEVLAGNPVTPYRFCILGDTTVDPDVPSYAWLTAAGTVTRDVSDVTDFRLVVHEPAPAWVGEAVVYQIFPDRFARTKNAETDLDGKAVPAAGVPLPRWAVPMAWADEPAIEGIITGQQFYGGDLDGIIERLDHIAGLGCDTIYLTPIFPAGSVHRYDASTFDEVDPLLGGNEALQRLVAAVHQRGMRIMLDLTTNHTGDTHEWFTTAVADKNSTEAGFYLFNQHPTDYVSWLGVESLPKLDMRSEELRRRLSRGPESVVGRYIGEPFGVDGWRIDVANMTGRHRDTDLTHEVARELRHTMKEAQVNDGGTWLLAEHGHDATRDLDGDGWHGTMNYVGFTRPLWAWLADPDSGINWLGLPMTVPVLSGVDVAQTIAEYNAQMPWPSRLHSMNQLASHDTPRTRTVLGTQAKQLVAIAALVGLPGVPTVFAGDELGAVGRTGEHSRTPMPWAAIESADGEQIDLEVLRATQTMLALRPLHAALTEGGFQWLHISPDVLVFSRTHPDGDVIAVLARAAAAAVTLDLAPAGIAALQEIHREGDLNITFDGTQLTLTAQGAGAAFVAASRSN